MRPSVHEVRYVQYEIGGHACHIGAARNPVKAATQLRVMCDVVPNILQAPPCTLQAAIEFGLGFGLCFTERHLHPAVGVDFAFAGGLDRQEDHFAETC